MLYNINFFIFDYFYIVFFCFFLTIHWFFFFKNNNFLINITRIENDKLSKKNVTRILNPKNYIRYTISSITILIIFLLSVKGDSGFLFFNYLYLNNFNFNVIFFFFLFLLTFNFLLLNLNVQNLIIKIDYYFVVNNISIVINFLYLCNNLLSFFFILETLSMLILYKFVILKNISFHKKETDSLNKSVNNGLNIIFFQYWVNFFSTIIILYCIMFFLNYFGSLDFVIINNLFSEKILNFRLIFIFILFFFAILFKLGLTPFHFYKLEVYKGLPMVSLYFYNVIFFSSFFFYFIFLFYFVLNNIFFYLVYVLYLFIFFGIFFMMFLMFDVLNFKSFLSYSTIINSLNFLFIILV